MVNQIAATVILYNPNEIVLNNLKSYIDQVDHVFAIDNSEIINHAITSQITGNPKITYINNNGNQGIAHALNVGANKAIEMGYKWLLTMDQDSQATPLMIMHILKCIESKDSATIGIISPYHANKFYPISDQTDACSKAITPMTSGNLLNLDVYQKVGPFLNEFFIDHVDTEYSLRLHQNGFSLLYANRAILNHNVGELGQHRFLWKKLFSTNHSPIRKYYVFRNAGYIIDQYENDFPEITQKIKDRYWIDPIIVLLYEKQKLAKLKMMIRGYLDYKRGIFGKYRD